MKLVNISETEVACTRIQRLILRGAFGFDPEADADQLKEVWVDMNWHEDICRDESVQPEMMILVKNPFEVTNTWTWRVADGDYPCVRQLFMAVDRKGQMHYVVNSLSNNGKPPCEPLRYHCRVISDDSINDDTFDNRFISWYNSAILAAMTDEEIIQMYKERVNLSDRVMISSKITESGRFLGMPISAQCLYFHAVMRADQDGVVDKYCVMHLARADEGDIEILEEKGYIKTINEDGDFQIVDWKEHIGRKEL